MPDTFEMHIVFQSLKQRERGKKDFGGTQKSSRIVELELISVCED